MPMDTNKIRSQLSTGQAQHNSTIGVKAVSQNKYEQGYLWKTSFYQYQ